MGSLTGLPGRYAIVDGEQYLYFSGTSYLGVAANEAFGALVEAGIKQFGGHFGGSRLNTLSPAIFKEAENWISGFTSAAASLIVSSGSLAAQLLIKFLKGHFIYAPDVHPAFRNGTTPFSGSFSDWVAWMQHNWPVREEKVIIVANSVNPIKLRAYNFNWVEQLPLNEGQLILVVDDSHGLGVLGHNGSGIWPSLPQREDIEAVVVSSLGKALGIPGGVILGRKTRIEHLWSSPFFGGASPPPPAFLYALVNSHNIYAKALHQLKENVMYFKSLTGHLSELYSIDDYPVVKVNDPELAPWLKRKKILISQLSYPSSNSPLCTRIVINAAHQKEDIHELARQLNTYFSC
jgi:8-amino-7-oxononanoate synthase